MTEENQSSRKKSSRWWLVARLVFGLLGLLACSRLIVASGKMGLARFFSTLSIVQSSVGPADRAVEIAPDDPETHYTRGLALVNANKLNEAVNELRQATRLRPHHYYQWLDLGVTLDRLGDQNGAEAALSESVRLAPNFAQPRWQLGSLLYRQEQYSPAFGHLRLAARSNRSLLQPMLELAWVASDGKADLFNSLAQPENRREQLELANFLAKQGKGDDAVTVIQKTDEPSEEDERAILRETVARLIEVRQFPQAFSIWLKTHVPARKDDGNQLVNGDLLYPINQNDTGFGWRLTPAQAVGISIDPSSLASGGRSFRIDLNGDLAVRTQILSQLVLVQPNSRYLLRFMAKSEALITGGPPLIVVRDVTTAEEKVLGQSSSLSLGTSPWAAYDVEFSTDEKSAGIVFALERSPCKESTCPIFGKLWLGELSLVKK